MNTFSALADPTRRSIVEMLAASGQLPVASIKSRFPMSPPAISQHLKVLREAGLVKVETKAQQRIYAVNPAGIGEIEDWAAQMKRVWNQRFDALDAVLKDEMKKTKKGKKHGKPKRK